MSYARNAARLARTGIITVDTANDLRNLTIYGGLRPYAVQTLGAENKGDDGGGTWRWNATSTTADNLGTVVLPAGHTGNGRWLREFSGAVNVKWFGAVGDGVTNDRSKVKAAIDAVGAMGGGTVFFPAGSYFSPYHGAYFANPNIMDLPNITLEGEKCPTYKSDFSALEGGTIWLNSLFFAADNFTIRNMGIDCGKTYCDANNSGNPVEGLIGIDRSNATIPAFAAGDPSKANFTLEDVVILSHKTGKPGDDSDVHAFLLENYIGWKVRNISHVMGGAGLVIKSSHGTMDGAYCRGSYKYSVLNKSEDYSAASYNTYSNLIIENLGNKDPNILTAADYDTNGFIIEAAAATAEHIQVSNVITNGVRNGVQFWSTVSGSVAQYCHVRGVNTRKCSGYAVLFGPNDVKNCTVSSLESLDDRRGVDFVSAGVINCAALGCRVTNVSLYSYINTAGVDSIVFSCKSINPTTGHFRISAGSCTFGHLHTKGSATRIAHFGGTLIGPDPTFDFTPSNHPMMLSGPEYGSMAAGDYTSLGIMVRNSAGGAINSHNSVGVEFRAVQPGTGTNTAGLDIMTTQSSAAQMKALSLTKDGGAILQATMVQETLTDLRTMTFYWKDNLTLGVAMKGSDGVTRHGSITVS